jgi:multidrug efflux pump subunit AcrB
MVLREMADSLSQHNEVASLQMYAGTAAPINFNGLVRQYYLRQAPHLGELQVNLVDKSDRDDKSHAIATRVRPELTAIAKRHGAAVKIVEVPPGPPVLAPIVAEIYGPSAKARQQLANTVRNTFERTDGLVDVDDSSTAANSKKLLIIDRRKASAMGVPQQAIVETIRAGLSGADSTYLHDGSKYAVAVTLRLAEQQQQSLNALLALPVRSVTRETVPLGQLVTVTDTVRDPVRYRKDLLPVTYVVADVAQRYDSPLYGLFATRSAIMAQSPETDEFFIQQPDNPQVRSAIKWDGEWQITYETFRDMGAAYAVGLVLIYLLVVAQFGSYITPLIIMAPIPLTIIGVMPGHALLGAQFTATSMIGMIALAGIIVRNSILLVDFIHLQLREGKSFEEAVVSSATIRAQPILLTGVAAMLGAFFILDDPIFNGLAISLIFGILVSTVLTLLVIPLLYYSVFSKRHSVHTPS